MRISIGDVKLYVDVDGAGLVIDGPSMRERPTLLMLHGGPGIDHTPFKQDFFAPLTRVAQVVYYDHRGNGRSDRGDPSDWNLDRWADDVVALCEAFGIEHPVVFGGSSAGSLRSTTPSATRTTRRSSSSPAPRPVSISSVRGKCLRCSAGPKRATSPRPSGGSVGGKLQGIPTRLHALVHAATPTTRSRARITRSLDVAAHFRHTGETRFDYRDRLHAIRCPVLVMAASLDPMVTIEATGVGGGLAALDYTLR